MQDTLDSTIPIRKGIAAAVLLGSLTSGCVTYKIDVEQVQNPVRFSLVDKRPASEIQGGQRSTNLPNCEYGISDVGDSSFSPPPIEVLRHSLEKSGGERLRDKTVVVESLRITRNNQAVLRAGLNEGKTSTYLALREGIRGTNCVAGPDINGGYTTQENPEGLPFFSVTFKGVVEQQSVAVRYFYVMSRDEYQHADLRELFPHIAKLGVDKIASEIMRTLQ